MRNRQKDGHSYLQIYNIILIFAVAERWSRLLLFIRIIKDGMDPLSHQCQVAQIMRSIVNMSNSFLASFAYVTIFLRMRLLSRSAQTAESDQMFV